jgi:methionyl-tRNA formyltransferase
MRVKILSERPMGRKVKRWLKSQGEKIVTKNPDILVVAYYPRILKKEEFEPQPTINFHPGLLPYNRGMYPHIWPLVDGSPAGVTIHYIDAGVDTGDIIGQVKIGVTPTMIASDLEKITQKEIFKLFKRLWPKIKKGVRGRRQNGKGSYHYGKEISTIQEFDRDTIMRLRACTFDDRSYGYFMDNGKKTYVGIKFFAQKDIDRFAKRNNKFVKRKR